MAIRRPRHPPSGAACTPPAVEPRLGRHHASCRMRLSALCVWRLGARLWQNPRHHMRADRACLRPRPASGEIVEYLRAGWLVRPPRRRARAPRRCTLAGGVWRSARAGRWRNPRAGAPVDTAGCGWRGGGTCGVVWAMRWRSRKGRRRPGGVWSGGGEVANGRSHVAALASLELCPLSPLSSLSALSLLPPAAIRHPPLHPHLALFPRGQPLPTCALSSCKRSATRVLWWRAFSALHNCSYSSLSRTLPRAPIFVLDFAAPGNLDRSFHACLSSLSSLSLLFRLDRRRSNGNGDGWHAKTAMGRAALAALCWLSWAARWPRRARWCRG